MTKWKIRLDWQWWWCAVKRHYLRGYVRPDTYGIWCEKCRHMWWQEKVR